MITADGNVFFCVCVCVFVFLLSNHNAISRLRPCQKMQRHREGLLCEWRRLLLHTWYKSALLQVSYLFVLNFFLLSAFSVPLWKSFHDVLYSSNIPRHPNYKFWSCCLFSWKHLICSSFLQQQQQHITGKYCQSA